jgi:lipopolysaccharide biosynthesis glycosyltransferase
MNLEGKSLGAIRDSSNLPILYSKHVEYIKEKWKKKEYFNAGVLLFDIEKAIKICLTTRCLDYLSAQSADQKEFFEDQDALNVVCHDDVKLIDDMWNFSSDSDFVTEKCVLIIHFMGAPKPGLFDETPPW